MRTERTTYWCETFLLSYSIQQYSPIKFGGTNNNIVEKPDEKPWWNGETKSHPIRTPFTVRNVFGEFQGFPRWRLALTPQRNKHFSRKFIAGRRRRAPHTCSSILCVIVPNTTTAPAAGPNSTIRCGFDFKMAKSLLFSYMRMRCITMLRIAVLPKTNNNLILGAARCRSWF